MYFKEIFFYEMYRKGSERISLILLTGVLGKGRFSNLCCFHFFLQKYTYSCITYTINYKQLRQLE